MEKAQAVAKAQAALAVNVDWQLAVKDALKQLASFGEIDLLFMFASSGYRLHFEEIVRQIYNGSGAKMLLGCSGQAIIGKEREIEDTPAISLLALSLPGAELRPVHFTNSELAEVTDTLAPTFAHYLDSGTGLNSLDINAWLLIADPFTMRNSDLMLDAFMKLYPGRPIMGGMASGNVRLQQTQLFMNDRLLEEGTLALAVGGDYTLRPVVSQGATPIGETEMVTASENNMVGGISGKLAFQVLTDTIKGLNPTQLEKFRRQPLVGLAVDEYKSDFGRGDYIIRQLMGVDPKNGVIAIGDYPRIGQTIQFQMRDAVGADEDLRLLLGKAKHELGESKPVGGLLFSCNGRGSHMFDTPDHDAATIAEVFDNMPLAGFFCNGEIGPIGSKTFLHSFTASLGLFVKK
jgi:small ligand-binding sensory domain FIST